MRPPSKGTLSLHDSAFRGSYEKYHTSAARRVKCLVKTLRDTYRCSDTDLFVSLDGKGANHDVFHRAYEGAAPGATPRFVIFEKDPLVACNQKMLYNDGVIYTGAMKREGFGFVGKAPPGIEYLISTRSANGVTNVLFTQDDCDRTVALYLDYCGGIMGGGLDFDTGQRILTKLVSRLPRLAVLAITFGKRRHDGLSSDFERYARTPHGFGVVKTFDDEKVVCRVFQRLFNIPRTLAVPGKHWVYGTDKVKSAQARLSKHACVIQKLEHAKGGAYDVFVHAVEPGGGTWEGRLSWKLSDARRLIREYNQRDNKALAKGTDKFKHKARRAIIANCTAQLSMIDEFWVAYGVKECGVNGCIKCQACQKNMPAFLNKFASASYDHTEGVFWVIALRPAPSDGEFSEIVQNCEIIYNRVRDKFILALNLRKMEKIGVGEAQWMAMFFRVMPITKETFAIHMRLLRWQVARTRRQIPRTLQSGQALLHF